MEGFGMDKKFSSFAINRRQFLTNILPAGTLVCLGCSNLLAFPQAQEKSQTSPEKHKFQGQSGMTFEQVFQFTYPRYITIMQNLANDIGKDKFIKMLKKASSEGLEQYEEQLLKNIPKRDLVALAAMTENNPLYKNALTLDIVEQTDKIFEIKVTECLWAKTFREAKEPDAAEIGYVTICHPDYAFARIYNPKIKLIRTKTLMHGHDCCNHRYVWEG